MWRREEAYRFYVADSLYFNGQSKAWNISYEDFLEKLEKGNQPEPEAEEIIEDIMRRHNLRFME